MSRFEQWYNSVPSNKTFSVDAMADFADERLTESIETNPNFYYGPFTGMIARNAGYLFIARLFANHSTANPGGVLSKSEPQSTVPSDVHWSSQLTTLSKASLP